MNSLNSTINVREFFETLSKEEFNKGKITYGQRESISKVIGHSIATADRCYVLADTQQVVSEVERAALGNDSDDEIDFQQYKGINYNRYVCPAYSVE